MRQQTTNRAAFLKRLEQWALIPSERANVLKQAKGLLKENPPLEFKSRIEILINLLENA